MSQSRFTQHPIFLTVAINKTHKHIKNTKVYLEGGKGGTRAHNLRAIRGRPHFRFFRSPETWKTATSPWTTTRKTRANLIERQIPDTAIQHLVKIAIHRRNGANFLFFFFRRVATLDKFSTTFAWGNPTGVALWLWYEHEGIHVWKKKYFNICNYCRASPRLHFIILSKRLPNG